VIAEEAAQLAFAAMLLLARLGACGMLLPGLGEPALPARVRLGLVLALVPPLLPLLLPNLPAAPDDPAIALKLLATEVAVGIWIGTLARLSATALAMMGQLAAAFVGLSSLIAPDPSTGADGTALARFMGIAAVALVMVTGLYAVPLRALAESYAVLPAGAPLPAGMAAEAMTTAVTASFSLALRLVAPLLLLSVVLQLATGLLTRAAPQAQVFILAAPAQTLAGLLLLAVLLPAILGHWGEATATAWSHLPGLR
jgi:flagellar biosynthetic protein FliR